MADQQTTGGKRRARDVQAALQPIQVQRATAAQLLGMSEDSLDRIPMDELPRFRGGPGDRLVFFRLDDLDAYSRACRDRALRAS